MVYQLLGDFKNCHFWLLLRSFETSNEDNETSKKDDETSKKDDETSKKDDETSKKDNRRSFKPILITEINFTMIISFHT